MDLVYHIDSFNISPMLIVDKKVEYVTNYLFHANDDLKGLSNEWHILKSYSYCPLDPGGMYCTKIDHIQFSIDGFEFDVQLSRIEEVLGCMERGEEEIPGYICFPNFRWFIVLPKKIFDKLKSKLKELEMSDDALNAELLEKDIKADVKKNWNKKGL